MFKVLIVSLILKICTADDTVSWDCPPGDASCEIQRDDPNNLKCGKFQKYNPGSTRTFPETRGVIGGYDYDGTPQYVGYGANKCDEPSQLPCPAAIYTLKKPNPPSFISYKFNTTFQLPGCYMACGDVTLYDNSSCYFLINHTDYNWVDTNITHMQTLTTALKIPGVYWTFMFGRKWYKNNWRFGKVHLNIKSSLGIRFQDENGTRLISSRGFQVLTCLRCKNGGTGQFCCKNGANNPDCCENGGYGKKCTLPCGHLLPLNSEFRPDDPKNPGFASGTYHDGSTVYPGIGYFYATDEVDVARIQLSSTLNGTGAYTPYRLQYLFDDKRPRFLLSHPNLKWVKTNVENAREVPGAIKNFLRFGNLEAYDFYARINFTNKFGKFSNIGYFWRSEACSWNGTMNACIRGAGSRSFDILTCSPNSEKTTTPSSNTTK